MDLNETLKQFEAVEANLAKLEKLWAQIKPILPREPSDGLVETDAYAKHKRSFEYIAKTMPRIDGYKFHVCLMDESAIFSGILDCMECGEISASLSFMDSVHAQGDALSEYRFHLDNKRRNLARNAMAEFRGQIEGHLAELQTTLAESDPANTKMPEELWSKLVHAFNAIDSLLGNAFARPPRWSDMTRHLHFGVKQDYEDIVRQDWPAIKTWLDSQLYVEHEPLPVAVSDLGEIVESKPQGSIATELNWRALSPEDFERLLFNLLGRAHGYQNPKWLTHLTAPDRGRDLSVERVIQDQLAGPRTEQVFVACKHTNSVGLPMLIELKEQTKLWKPLKVDQLIVATSGRFTTDAIQWTEEHNNDGVSPRIDLWANSHLERLLRGRPELIGEFKLRP